MGEDATLFVRTPAHCCEERAVAASAQPRLQKWGERNIISKHFNLLPERKRVSVPICCASPFLKAGELKRLEITHLSSLFPGWSQHR